MAYTPPGGGSVGLDFVGPALPPSGGDVNLEFDVVNAEAKQVGGWRSSAVAAPSVRSNTSFLKASGADTPAFGLANVQLDVPRIYPASIDPTSAVSSPEYVRWRRFLTASGAPAPAESFYSVTRVRLLGGYNPPPGSSVVLNWTGDPYSVPPGGNVVLEFGALGSGYILGVTLGQLTGFGAATLTQPVGIRPTGIGSTAALGTPTLTSGTQAISLSGFSIAPGGFGTAVLSEQALGIFATSIAPTSAIGTPFIAYRIRYLSPGGIAPVGFGATVIQNWIRYLTMSGADQSAYGTAVLTRGVRSLAPTGIDSALYGTPSIDNKTRYYNLLGWTSSIVATGARVWDGKQYAINVTLGDGMFMPSPIVSFPALPPDDTQTVELSGQGMPIPDNQVWPLHKIENRNKQAFPEGFTSYGLGAPRVDQTIYLTIRPLGADWSVFGTPFVDQTIKKLYPEGFTSEFVPASHQIYNYRIDVVAGGLNSYVSGAHTVLRGTARPVVPGIASKAVVATGARVEYRVRTVTPHGWDTTIWGTAVVQNKNVWVAPGGIPPLPQTGPSNQWRIPAPTIWYRVRYIGPSNAGGIYTGAVPTTHQLTQYVQRIDFAARGIAPGGFDTPFISNRYREIFPTFVASMIFGTATVKRRIFVEPTGWDSAFFSENAEVLINTRRVYVLTGEADPAEYGVATVFNWTQTVDLDRNGWYDTQWNFPVVYNLKQEVKVGPFMDNLTPDQWGRYYPFVENKNRELRTFGHISSRVSIAGWIHNAADPVYPVGTDMTLWGADTFIAHRNRTVQAQGWDSFYNERYTVVWNLADAVAPASIGDTARYGTASVVNLNREVKQHSGWSGPDWGTPFVAYRVRTVAPGLFYDVPASFPEVRHNPFPIAPVGIPKLGQVGGHELRIFRREVFPYAVNVHDPWFGEAGVRNRNVTVAPYGYDQAEYGRATVENFIRYVSPEGFRSDDVPKHLISRRTRELNPLGIANPLFTQLHRIRNVLPDPPGLQTIDLSRTSNTGEVDDGDGIPPPGAVLNPPRPTIRLNTIYPSWEAPSARSGVGRVWSNALEAKFWQSDGEVGVPTLIFTQYVAAKSVDSAQIRFGDHRMTPFTIYAPRGSERPKGYTPSASGGVIDSHLSSPDGNSHPWFGRATVTNQRRAIGPVPYRSGAVHDDLNGRTKWGTAAFALRRQYVYVDSIRSLRMGFPVLWGVPQYVNLDDPGANAGIPPYNAFGTTVVAFPVDPHAPQYVRPNGYVATLWGTNRVELLNRVVAPQGIPHRGNPQQNLTTPWGTALVGYPRRYSIGMGVQTLWGTHVIEYVNRQVWPEGWNSCTLESWDFENYKFPMKVVRKNPLVRPASMGDVTVFGSCTVSQRVRTVYARGVDSYNSGSHSVKASSTIGAQGWESLLIGDIDRWEAGKIKAHGDDMSTVGTPRLLHPLRASGFDSSVVAAPRIAPVVSPVGIPNIAFDGPSVTNPFGCTNRVVSPLPILSNQTVPSPVVA